LINKNRSNILLENKEGRLNAVICDFGLARVQASDVIISIQLLFFFYFLSH